MNKTLIPYRHAESSKRIARIRATDKRPPVLFLRRGKAQFRKGLHLS